MTQPLDLELVLFDADLAEESYLRDPSTGEVYRPDPAPAPELSAVISHAVQVGQIRSFSSRGASTGMREAVLSMFPSSKKELSLQVTRVA